MNTREAFEVWARGFHYDLTRCDPSYVNEPYANDFTDWCWLAWEEASKEKEELLEALKLARDYVQAEFLFRQDAYAGYPHKWSAEERDLALIDAVIKKADEGVNDDDQE